MKLLIVDDEPVACSSVRRLLRHRGIADADLCDNGREAVDRIRATDYDIVLLDLLMPGMDGLQVLEAAKPHRPLTEFIMVTAVEDVSTSVRAMRLGAYDYLVKPLDPDRLLIAVQRAYERRGLRLGLGGAAGSDLEPAIVRAFGHLVTRDPRLRELIRYTHVMARGGVPVLITGESGTGKELFARGIHHAGPGGETPFVPVNVTSVPESLFESQFFGHAKGAFTGASDDHKGYFLQADGGTLYLDEIGEIPLHLQVKLLRVLEEKSLIRVGKSTPRKFRLQIVSSTNADLDLACRDGRFRLDLLYRLNAAHVRLPSLRERPGDIPLLAEHFLQEAGRQHGKAALRFSPEALDLLAGRPYPGNVRELRQLVETAVVLADGDRIIPRHLGGDSSPTDAMERGLCTLKENADAHVVSVYVRTGGDTRQAARILGITVRQVQRRIAQLRQDSRWRVRLADASPE